MAIQEILVIGTVVVTGFALVTYRLLGIRGREVVLSAAPPTTLAAGRTVNIKSLMMVLISILILCSSLFIIISGNYDEGSQKWAFGTVGSIMGFWLRPEK